MDDIVKEAREALELSYEFDRDNRREAMEDLRFTAGFQWSDQAKTERAGRPMITINRSGQFLRQVSNPIRQNMPTLKVEPDGDADLDLAEVANGLFRRIQYNSSASHVYAQAVEHMVACGIGWFRVLADFEDDESFDQELKIKRVFHPLSVYPDPASLEPDRSNMSFCLVSEMMPQKAFQQRWKKLSPESVSAPNNGTNGAGLSWGSADYVRIAEFWRRKEYQKTIAKLKDGQTVDISEMPSKQLEFLKFNGMIVATREATSHKVVMTLVSGTDVLADEYECPCRWIPLVPVIGAEIPLEQGTYRHGLIRFQREPQQLHNYFMSVAAETLGQQPKTPYLATADQIGKYKPMWDEANKSPQPYLLYEPDARVQGAAPKRVEPPPLPAGLIHMAQMLADDMKSTTGIYDAALGARSNETSGVAIGQRVEQGNQATFHFVDNLEHALEHTGRILLDMIPKIYDNERTLRIMSEDGTETEVQINKPTISFDEGPMVINDLSQMNFKSVRVVMGPSYASRRQEAVQTLTQLITAMPQIGAVGADIVVRHTDFDGAEELSERLKVTLPPQVLQIANPEAFAAQQPPEDPLAQMQMQGQAEMLNAEVESAKAKADQEKSKAVAEQRRAEGAELDNALKVKELREPPPRPGNGADAGFRQPAE